MTIYNFNMGIGWASSGVEYAQSYRAQAFEKLKVDNKFIFTDLILNENIIHLTNNMGFKKEHIIWLYQFFSDIPLTETTVTVEQILSQFNERPIRQENGRNYSRFYFNEEGDFITCYFVKGSDQMVHRTEVVTRHCLIRKDFYSDQKYLCEYYIPHEGRATVYYRRWLNSNGQTALEEIVNDKESLYRVNSHTFYSKTDLVAYFISCLKLTNDDIIIIDRSNQIAPAVFANHGQAKIGIVVHADHFSEPSTNDTTILWNNYYEYEFHYIDEVDFVICATQPQTNLLKEQFLHYKNKQPKIYTIPVGSLDKIHYQEERVPYSLITASRLAKEKHIDLLIEAVVEARKAFPQIHLDIYGEGGEREDLTNLISQHNAGEYIKLRGHQNLTRIYKDYEAYLSASMSEGFGLTLMEALGSGLPIIGFDVRYGNQNFIKDNCNGYLLNLGDRSKKHYVEVLVNAIKMLFNQDRVKLRSCSYQLAQNYTLESVSKLWSQLIEEVKNC
ncbi:accessory Sec system glycosyltransferase GtfA [Facklamia sp. 7083-14-GEN3]|uniref:accessory Sec system glycosyltransferase GtfA n=1 Tax=Facklamia sp. 7083-14-GEN3 TaxID=2973478 RepID=UPI00215CAC57|nr:accessory Sec system glycosyltransferase GtfA [Facklamia sp. 7083-14-GEN3]MCR8968378.1 accessory Sec system glycosyltransferase GtfA [Facklamia sp. 7083-14-GEN3]